MKKNSTKSLFKKRKNRRVEKQFKIAKKMKI